MADNITANGVGPVASDDIAGVAYPRVKLITGADAVNDGDVSNANALPVRPGFLPGGTDKSGSITTGGTAQQLAAANSSRRALLIQNISSGDIWVNEMGTAVVGSAGFKLVSGDSYYAQTNRAVSVIATVTGQAWTAIES